MILQKRSLASRLFHVANQQFYYHLLSGENQIFHPYLLPPHKKARNMTVLERLKKIEERLSAGLSKNLIEN